nr:hypothetical protein [Tanacetum cinerariifolium]
MGNKNPIRTLGDYSRPSHEGYRNTVELSMGTMWCLCDPTPLGWCKTDAHSTDYGEQNKNSTSPKRVHFVNTVTVLRKDDKPGEKGIAKPDTKDDDHDTIVKIKDECKESEEKGKEEKGEPENINANPPSPPDPS